VTRLLNLLFATGLFAATVVLAEERPWVLLDGDQGAMLIHQCSRESPEAVRSAWTPSAAVIEKMESRLTDITRLKSTLCCGAKFNVDDVGHYYRQYAGLVIEDKKLIYINAFARTAVVNDWRQEPVLICDGGRSFWGVLYDPATEKFFDLAFNGES